MALSLSLLNDLLLPLVDLLLFLLKLEGELSGLVSSFDLKYKTRVVDPIMMSDKLGLLKSEIMVLSLLGVSELLVDLLLSQLLASLLLILIVPNKLLLKLLWHVNEHLELLV